MNKYDLQTGHIVTFRNGNRMHVYRNATTSIDKNKNIFTDGNTWCGFDTINEDLSGYIRDYDIVKVECATDVMELYNHERAKEIWKETKRKMTVAEIEMKLGYGIEIISEKQGKTK